MMQEFQLSTGVELVRESAAMVRKLKPIMRQAISEYGLFSKYIQNYKYAQ